MSLSPEPDRVAQLLFWLPLLLIALAGVVSLVAVPHLPERMPIHWGLDGQPTRLASRSAALILPLVFMLHAWLMVGLIGWALTRSGDGAAVPPRVMAALTTAVVGFLLLLHLAMLANGLGRNVPIPLVANLGVGLLLVVLGRLMRDVPPNPVFGVRTPTTLRSPAAWQRANEVGGRGFMFAGVATMVGALLPPRWTLAVLFGSLVAATAAAIVAGRRAEREEGEHA